MGAECTRHLVPGRDGYGAVQSQGGSQEQTLAFWAAPSRRGPTTDRSFGHSRPGWLVALLELVLLCPHATTLLAWWFRVGSGHKFVA